MSNADRIGIVLAPYGTLSSNALSTYRRMAKAYEMEFPGQPVRLAFTSELMRKRLSEREGIFMPGLTGALEDLKDIGCECAVVQSLHIVPGGEFHKLAAAVRDLNDGEAIGLSGIRLGLPLLSSLEDCLAVSALLPSLLSRHAGLPASADGNQGQKISPGAGEEGLATLMVGHGTGHLADSIYSLLARLLRREEKNLFLGSIEGSLGLEETLHDLKSSGARAVRLMPFLLVAGGHAEDDIFGEGSQSWKSILEREGYDVIAVRQGLGEFLEIVSIFSEHTRRAIRSGSQIRGN
ncbi:MAG: sirohydrochlorin cobaltochelatase [Methanothrix sp.]